MKTSENPAPHKLGANRRDPARKRRVAKHPTAESRDVREDRATRQSKLMPQRGSATASVGRKLLAPQVEPLRIAAPVPVPLLSDTHKLETFELHHDSASNVFIAGTFNDWDPTRHALVRGEGGNWRLELPLGPGRHEYLFVADGCWMPDPGSAESVVNPFGGHNSVRTV